MAQAGDEGRCHPMPVRHAANHTLAAWSTAIAAGHIRRRPGFINEDQLGGVQLRLTVAPSLSRRSNVGTALLRGVLGLFLRVRSSWRSVFHIPRWLIETWCATRSHALSSV